MKKILIFLVAFFPLLAGATTSGFQFDPSSSDLNSIEINSINLDDWKCHTWEFIHNGNVEELEIIKINFNNNVYYQIRTHYGPLDPNKKTCLAFLGQMREQLGCWKWYEGDGITEIDGYKDNPIRLECIYCDKYNPFMNVFTKDIKTTIEATSGFVKWIE